ncbi:hypothetical protein QQF64_017370 [Cirrhinus molitorella]|uniref:Uncharacterized protein n=1 Tax=Cirrhinus molitorella TaxID=172907 RepID=A0ABR3LIG5_9TELE
MTRLTPRQNLVAGPIHMRAMLNQPWVPQNKTSMRGRQEEQHNRLTMIARHNKTYTGGGVGNGGYRLAREAPDSDRRGEGNGRDAPTLGCAVVRKTGFGTRIYQGFAGVDRILVGDGGRKLGMRLRGDKRRNAHQDSPVS